MRAQGSGSKIAVEQKAKAEAKPKPASRKASPGVSQGLQKPPLSLRALFRELRNQRALEKAGKAADGFGAHVCGPSCGHAAPSAERREALAAPGVAPARTAPTSIRAGGFTVHTSGIGQPGVEESINIATRLSQRPDIAERLRKNKVDLVLLPHDKKLTDVPQFSQLRGKKTFDGRKWDGVRGVANVSQNNGRVAVALPEENLIELPQDPYGGNFSVGIHEVAHAVHEYGVSGKERQQILDAFNAQKDASGRFTDDYAASNEYEYFAQATSAYLGRNDGQGKNGASWLKKHDPRIYGLLEKVYGPPERFRSVDPTSPKLPQPEIPKKPDPKPELPKPQQPKPPQPKPELPKPEIPKPEIPKPEIPKATGKTVRNGSRGEDVRALQLKLRAAGYLADKADGIFGPRTEAAVRSFQRANGLDDDGVVGPRTWSALATVQG